MKKIIFNILLFLLGCFVTGCNQNNLVEPKRYFSVSGWIMDYNVDMPIKYALINIDDLQTTTNEYGFYNLSSVSEGTHTISVSSPNYETYSQKINISKDTSVVVDLKSSQLADYFPIRLGIIRYRYNERYESHSQYFIMVGEAEWNISSTYSRNDSTFYEVSETKTYTTNSGPTEVVKRDFKIIEDSAHKIFITRSLLYSDHLTFNRYINVSQPDSITFRHGSGFFSLKRNVGLSLIFDTDGSSKYWKFELIQ